MPLSQSVAVPKIIIIITSYVHLTSYLFRSKLKHNAALLQLPIGKDSNTAGLVDIVRDRAIYFDGSFGETVRYDEVPSEYREEYDNFIDLRKISFKTQSIDQYKRSAMRVNVNAL